MKTFIASLMLLLLSNNLAPQPIFIAHNGGEPLIEVSEWSDKEIEKKGEPCGKYFLYQQIQHQGVVTMKVQSTEKEARVATGSVFGMDLGAVSIRLDDARSVPTAEWVPPPKESRFLRRILIRISGQEYVSAPCLATVNPSY